MFCKMIDVFEMMRNPQESRRNKSIDFFYYIRLQFQLPFIIPSSAII